MKHKDRVKEFEEKFCNGLSIVDDKSYQYTGIEFKQMIDIQADWLLTQFNEIDQDWRKKIDDMRHTVHTNCCCNDMIDKLLK